MNAQPANKIVEELKAAVAVPIENVAHAAFIGGAIQIETVAVSPNDAARKYLATRGFFAFCTAPDCDCAITKSRALCENFEVRPVRVSEV